MLHEHTMTSTLVLAFCMGGWLGICTGQSSTYDERVGNYTALYSFYSFGTNGVFDTVIPKEDTTQPIDVSLQMKLYSVGDVDAVAGRIQLFGALKMVWQDTIITAIGSKALPLTSPSDLVVDYRRLWTPVIVLMNSADSVDRIGDEAYKVRYETTTKTVTWQPRVLIEAACAPNVRYFPFDQQECSLTFLPWGQNKTKIKLSVLSDEWDVTDYSENGVWKIDKTASAASEVGEFYNAVFTITINRVPTYFLINIVFPILCLSLLSGMIFLLPAASGERIGFGITCFLSFVVLLQTLMQFLPRTSSPMSLLCYYVIIMMVLSATLSIVTIILLRLYHKPKNAAMPNWLKRIVELINCTICKRNCCGKRNSVGPKMPGKTSNNNSTQLEVMSISSTDKLGDGPVVTEENDLNDPDWEDLGRIFDSFFFLVFLGVQAAVSLFFLVPIAARL